MSLGDAILGKPLSASGSREEELGVWTGVPVLGLEVLDSPYRRVSQPISEYVNSVTREKADRLVAVIIPQLVEPQWYEYFLHSVYGMRLRTRLFAKGNDRVVVDTPWPLRET